MKTPRGSFEAMLIQVVVVVVFSNVVSSRITQGLYAVTNIKDNVHRFTKNLDDFRTNVTANIKFLENSLWENRKKEEPPEQHMNQTICLQTEIPKARMEVMKLLNMLVEGEKNQLLIVESSLNNMKFPTVESDIQELHKFWGSLVLHGESEDKIEKEMADFRNMAKKRFEDVRKKCIGTTAIKTTKNVENV